MMPEAVHMAYSTNKSNKFIVKHYCAMKIFELYNSI